MIFCTGPSSFDNTDSSLIRELLHRARVSGVRCHRLLGRYVNVPLRALTHNLQMTVVRRGDDHRLRLRLVEHTNVGRIEVNASRHLRFCFADQFRMRVSNRDEFSVGFFCDVMQQSPYVIVIEANDCDACLAFHGRGFVFPRCRQPQAHHCQKQTDGYNQDLRTLGSHRPAYFASND